MVKNIKTMIMIKNQSNKIFIFISGKLVEVNGQQPKTFYTEEQIKNIEKQFKPIKI